LGETLLLASVRAMTGALLVKSLSGGRVAFVLLPPLHFLTLDRGSLLEAFIGFSILWRAPSCHSVMGGRRTLGTFRPIP